MDKNVDRQPADIRPGQLAAATGLSPLLIRAWERRYGFPRAERTSGGHRRYAPSEVARLRRAVLLVRAGFRPRDAIQRLLEGDVPVVEVGGGEELQELLTEGEPGEGLAQLRVLEHAIGFEEALEEVVLPSLRAIGVGWADGRYSVAQEHAASSLIGSWLGTVRATLPEIPSAAPSVLLGAAPDERHGLPPLALELLLRRRGMAAASLDADVPMTALSSAVQARRPAAVVISVSQPNPALAATVAELDGLEPRPRIYVGGPGLQHLPAGSLRLPPRLTWAADRIAGDFGLLGGSPP